MEYHGTIRQGGRGDLAHARAIIPTALQMETLVTAYPSIMPVAVGGFLSINNSWFWLSMMQQK